MSTKRIISVLLFIFGEALIIICFLYFGRNFTQNILTLNIIVTSVIYLLYFSDIILPVSNFKDRSQRTIASIGIMWFFNHLYTILAIAGMIIFNTVYPINVSTQVIIHGILLFTLFLGFYFALSASQKVYDVFTAEEQNRSRLEEMKKITGDIQIRLDQLNDVPSAITDRISLLYENLRFISPNNKNEAVELELNFTKEIRLVQDGLFEMPVNYERITTNIQNCESIYKERKQLYSI